MLKTTVLWTAYRFYIQKVEKTTRKSSILKQKFGRFRNFHFTAQQPKWQNSWSQMGPIEQLGSYSRVPNNRGVQITVLVGKNAKI